MHFPPSLSIDPNRLDTRFCSPLNLSTLGPNHARSILARLDGLVEG